MQREAVGLDEELVQLRVVDDPQDLPDVLVGEGHQPPAPNRCMTSDMADAGAASRLGRPVTGRDWRTYSVPARSIAHSTSWGAPKCPSTRPLSSTSAASSPASRHGAVRRSASTATSTVPRPPGAGTYSISLSWMCSRTISPVTLLTR